MLLHHGCDNLLRMDILTSSQTQQTNEYTTANR